MEKIFYKEWLNQEIYKLLILQKFVQTFDNENRDSDEIINSGLFMLLPDEIIVNIFSQDCNFVKSIFLCRRFSKIFHKDFLINFLSSQNLYNEKFIQLSFHFNIHDILKNLWINNFTVRKNVKDAKRKVLHKIPSKKIIFETQDDVEILSCKLHKIYLYKNVSCYNYKLYKIYDSEIKLLCKIDNFLKNDVILTPNGNLSITIVNSGGEPDFIKIMKFFQSVNSI